MRRNPKVLTRKLWQLLLLLIGALGVSFALGTILPAAEETNRLPVSVESAGASVPGLKCKKHAELQWQCDGSRVFASEPKTLGDSNLDTAVYRVHRFYKDGKVSEYAHAERVAPDTALIRDVDSVTVARLLPEDRVVFFHFEGDSAQREASRFEEGK